MMTPEFKIGQLVRIKSGLNDDDLPIDNRVGLVLGHPIYEAAEELDLWHVSVNGKTLTFNEDWLEPVPVAPKP